jgi:hypothetical protein
MWAALHDELDRWGRLGRTARFWWRDDDATADTPQLEHLIRCARGAPLAIAVIPGRVQPSLAARLASVPSASVLQHGWKHTNQNAGAVDGSGAPQRPSEYPPGRPGGEVKDEVALGRRILGELFGAQSLPVFAPPWHGFAEDHLPRLAECGLVAMSRKGPRPAEAAGGLAVSNIHVAVRKIRPPAEAAEDQDLERICEHLHGRREGLFDPHEPTGILTHHLKQDAASMDFVARLAGAIFEHPAARWLDARDVFRL